MKLAPSKQLAALLALLLVLPARRSAADCSVTNLGVTPLTELGFTTYLNSVGGLYPNGANTRPPAHDSAGMRIATNEIVPLNASGNTDTNNGKIVLLSLGVSNTTQEWASGDNVTHNITNAFKYLADVDPSMRFVPVSVPTFYTKKSVATAKTGQSLLSFLEHQRTSP